MAFLLAFACTVASVDPTAALVCSDRNRVTLAGIRATAGLRSDQPLALVGQRLRCQAFDSAGPGELTATCRLPSGEDLGCNLIAQKLAKPVARERRRYELADCRRVRPANAHGTT